MRFLPLLAVWILILLASPREIRADAEPPHHNAELPLDMPGWFPQAFLTWVDGGAAYDVATRDLPDEIKAMFATARKYNVQPFFDYYGVFLGNPVGGNARSAQYGHEIIFGAEVSLGGLSSALKETSIIVSGVQGAGRNLSAWIGNDLTVNEAYTQQTIALANLALKQHFFDDKVELRVGRMAAGQFFASLPAFGLQVNGGINGNPNGLYDNLPNFKTSTGSSWAAYAKWLSPHDTYVQSGIFQSDPRSGQRAYHGLNLGFNSDNGFLWMTELGWMPTFGKTEARSHAKDTAGKSFKSEVAANPGLPGIYAVGGYWSNYTFSSFTGGNQPNAYGFYAMGQQMLWRSATNENFNFSSWAALTYAPQNQIAMNPLMGAVGTILQGFIPTRDKDQLLFTLLIQNYGPNYRESAAQNGGGNPSVEAVLEASYLIQLTQNLSIQPDLQYVIQPSGSGNIPNALVLGLQVIAQF